ncbi:MAG: vWA domain-containing protein, partial [bacterium]
LNMYVPSYQFNTNYYMMKSKNKISKGLKKMISILLLVTFLPYGCNLSNGQERNYENEVTSGKKKKSIQMAILLDTSNSMDGLIEQAKSQLWSIVNELAKATCEGDKPDLHIALYEYGNDNLPSSEGYIRMVTPLTSDLDQISGDLFSLTTKGGQEYCGYVIKSALDQLEWNNNVEGYQVIFVAGNEPFNQGNIDFRKSCTQAKNKSVIVNTIFCGNFQEGINSYWKEGATMTGGDYMSIEQNSKTVYIESPYDKDIMKLNQRLNETYIHYGQKGYEKKEMQAQQDRNAESYGAVNSVQRTVSKSSHVYKNSSWDLVDASKDKDFSINQVKEEELPEEMRSMNDQEKKDHIQAKMKEREKIQQQILELNKKREAYVADKQKENSQDNMLDQVLLSTVRKQASSKNLKFE